MTIALITGIGLPGGHPGPDYTTITITVGGLSPLPLIAAIVIAIVIVTIVAVVAMAAAVMSRRKGS